MDNRASMAPTFQTNRISYVRKPTHVVQRSCSLMGTVTIRQSRWTRQRWIRANLTAKAGRVKSFSSLQKFNKLCSGQSRLCLAAIYQLRGGFDGDKERHLDIYIRNTGRFMKADSHCFYHDALLMLLIQKEYWNIRSSAAQMNLNTMFNWKHSF